MLVSQVFSHMDDQGYWSHAGPGSEYWSTGLALGELAELGMTALQALLLKGTKVTDDELAHLEDLPALVT